MAKTPKDQPAEMTMDVAGDVLPEGDILNRILQDLGKFTEASSPLAKSADLDAKKRTKEDEKNPSGVNIAFDLDVTGAGTTEMIGLGVYRNKANLIPDEIIKRITGPGGDDLVSQIITARSNHAALAARPRESRFDIGFDLVPKDKSKLPEDAKDMETLMRRVEKVKEFILSCGGPVVGEQQTTNFSQYIKMISRDGQRFGRHATSLINDSEGNLVAFRAADAGTIYKTARYKDMSDLNSGVRKQALETLKRLYNLSKQQFDLIKFQQNKEPFVYAQVIHGQPKQLFTADEMIVHNVYPVTDVEFSGYPLTPIDMAIHAITTHINITMHNKLYFQHGRAARGMLIIKSRNTDTRLLQTIKSQFQQTINSVRNSHRMPVFGVGPEDSIDWKPIDNSGRDMEFSYLSDSNARVILGAFQMSPDELPGYSHLSRGSNTQALSESNNEFKLTAARDVGLRPFLTDIQDFFNQNILYRIDKEVAESFAFAFMGLDKDDPQKESTRLSQDMGVWMSLNEAFDAVEKERISPEMGGDAPLNAQYWGFAEKYLSFGEILENFFKRKGASKDPRFNFYQNPFWMQWKQMEQMDVQGRVQLMLASMQAGAPQQAPQPAQGQEPQSEEAPVQKSEQSLLNTEAEFQALKKKILG